MINRACAAKSARPNSPCAYHSPGQQGTPQSNAGVDDIHYTPGNPFWVRGGIAVYF